MQCWVAESWRIRAREKPRGTTFNVHKPLLRQIMKNAPPRTFVGNSTHSRHTLQPIIHYQPTLPTVNVIHIQRCIVDKPLLPRTGDAPCPKFPSPKKPSSSTHPSTPPPGTRLRNVPTPPLRSILGAFLCLSVFDSFGGYGVRDRGPFIHNS